MYQDLASTFKLLAQTYFPKRCLRRTNLRAGAKLADLALFFILILFTKLSSASYIYVPGLFSNYQQCQIKPEDLLWL